MAKKMQRVIFTGLLSFFLVLVLGFESLAATDMGAAEPWDGVISVNFPNPRITLKALSFQKYTEFNGSFYPEYTNVSYSGSTNILVQINPKEWNNYINGYVMKRVRIPVPPLEGEGTYLISDVSSDVVNYNGMSISTIVVNNSPKAELVFDIYIQFDNFYVDWDVIRIPFKIDFSAGVLYQTMKNTAVVPYVTLYPEVIADYSGDIWQYGKLQDVPSIDGELSSQNQEIIDNGTQGNQLQEQSNQLQEQQNQLVQNQTQQQHQDANDMMHGFDNTAGNAANGQLNDSLGSLEQAQDSLFGSAGDMIQFDDYKNIFNLPGIITSVGFVSSMLTSIFQSSDTFGVILIVGFLLFVITRLLGMQNFGGK